MKHIWTDTPSPKRTDANKRGRERRVVALPARLTWKDRRGTTRFATVVARNSFHALRAIIALTAAPIP